MKTSFFSKVLIGLWMAAVTCVSVAIAAEAQASDALPGLVSWWRADGDATDSADGNNGTLVNGTSFAAGHVGQAFSLDGIDDHVLIGNPANLNFGLGDFTVTAWVSTSFLGGVANDFIVSKMSLGQDQQYLLGYGAGTGGGIPVQGAPFFNVADPAIGVARAQAPCNIADGDFHHLAGVRQGTTVQIYVDGQLAGTGTSPVVISATSGNNVVIGGRQATSNDPYFNGLIDEVQIYGRALSASEVQELFDAHDDGSTEPCIPTTDVPIDIKPGSCPNSFNRNSHDVLPVALVGTDSFDVTQVDISSILLSRADGVGGSVAPNEGPPGPHSEFEDAATPFEGELCDCHELEGDGILDLSMKFRTDEVVAALELDDFQRGDLVELVVTGILLDGTEFEAGDCILIVR